MPFTSFEIFKFIFTELARTVTDFSNASVLTSDLVGMFTLPWHCHWHWMMDMPVGS